jgi:hypothetical protein
MLLTDLRPRRTLSLQTSSKTVGIFFAASLLLSTSHARATIVSVNAGTNGTTGWTFSTTSGDSNQNGSFTGAAGATTMGTSWGLYANSGQTASMTYSFASALLTATGSSTLPVGGTVQIQLSLGNVNTGGTVGIALQNNSGTNRFETYYIGSDPTDAFKLNDAGGQENITGPNTTFAASNWPTNIDYQTILFTQLVGNTYSLEFDGLSVTNTDLTLVASDISQIRFFNFNAGAGNNQYANNLVVVPEPGSFMIIGAGLALASLRRLTSKRRAA